MGGRGGAGSVVARWRLMSILWRRRFGRPRVPYQNLERLNPQRWCIRHHWACVTGAKMGHQRLTCDFWSMIGEGHQRVEAISLLERRRRLPLVRIRCDAGSDGKVQPGEAAVMVFRLREEACGPSVCRWRGGLVWLAGRPRGLVGQKRPTGTRDAPRNGPHKPRRRSWLRPACPAA